jgi:apolipoprotein N-acyltransferase
MSKPARRSWLFCAATGIFLTFCFPHSPLGFLAWFSFIPLLWAIEHCQSGRQALFYGLIAGLVFFGISLYWLIYVTVFGWIFVACLEASFVMLFGGLVYEGRKIRHPFLKILWISLSWSSLELVRSEMPVFGLGWNLLAYSQSDYPWILQSANTVGAYGLGFVIAFVNACLFEILIQATRQRLKIAESPLKFLKSAVFGLLSLVFIVFSLLLGHGYYHFHHRNSPNASLRISVLQGNIPQVIKWEPVAREKIIELYSRLTQLAAFERPDLIIWPEAAFPGYFNQDPEAEGIQELVRQIHVPVIIGSPHFESWTRAFNSAYLLGPEGAIQNRYDKLYLVPFGEYVPLKPIFGWLEPIAYSLGVSDFQAGTQYTLFQLKDQIPFAVLICFEDVFPNLARSFVHRGARFLAVITNDAWFGPSSAPYQHLQASIFRAVENGVPVVRAANTGISAFISKKGVVLDRVEDSTGHDIFVAGKKTLTIPLEDKETLYRKGGYLFPYGALILFGTMFVVQQIKYKAVKHGRKIENKSR